MLDGFFVGLPVDAPVGSSVPMQLTPLSQKISPIPMVASIGEHEISNSSPQKIDASLAANPVKITFANSSV